MAIGERIRFLRNLRGMTMKALGMAIGFNEKAADVRISQYESGKRTPKENVINDLSQALDVYPYALDVPDIESDYGMMHTLFILEDTCGFRISEIDGEVCLRISNADPSQYASVRNSLSTWNQVAKKFKDEQISKAEYDYWRYNYPKSLAEENRSNLDALREQNKTSSENKA